jgi:hypothetical protein
VTRLERVGLVLMLAAAAVAAAYGARGDLAGAAAFLALGGVALILTSPVHDSRNLSQTRAALRLEEECRRLESARRRAEYTQPDRADPGPAFDLEALRARRDRLEEQARRGELPPDELA